MNLLMKSKPKITIIIALLIACSVVWLPELLTGYSGPASKTPYHAMSYLRGVGLFLFVFQLFLLGAALSLAAKSSGYEHEEPGIFSSAIIGLAVFIPAFYLRSLLGSLLGLPITQIELLFYSFAALYVTRRTDWRKRLMDNAIPLFLFGLLCVALAQHEMPRTIMLSSDPDQHSFFAAQVAKYGLVPFAQQDWGGLSFGYPAATGIMIFIASSLSFSSIADATNILPQLLAYVGIFAMVEVLLKRQERLNQKIQFAVLTPTILIFHYVLPYGLEPGHFHHEGYGRLLALCFFALLVSWSLTATPTGSDQRSHPLLVIIVGCAALFCLLVINPINGFIAAWMFAWVYLLKYPSKFWMLILPLFVAPLLLLDPYYFELVFSEARTGGVIVTPRASAVDTTSILNQFFSRLGHWNQRGMSFFRLPYLPNVLMVFCLLIALSTLLRGTITGFIKPFLLLLVIYIGWIIFSAAFDLLSSHPTFRLLLPYLQFNREQFLYLMFFALIAPIFAELSKSVKSWLPVCLFAAFLGYGLNQHQEGNASFNKTSRVNYCGSMGCLTDDDKQVLEAAEQLYLSSTESFDRMLIPNAASQHGVEGWIMPRGGGRSVHFYETFPTAFFYYQGDADYTADNYRLKVCQSLDISWLKSKNIRYLFTPTQMLDACVFGYTDLDSKFEVLSRSGSSSLYRLY